MSIATFSIFLHTHKMQRLSEVRLLRSIKNKEMHGLSSKVRTTTTVLDVNNKVFQILKRLAFDRDGRRFRFASSSFSFYGLFSFVWSSAMPTAVRLL